MKPKIVRAIAREAAARFGCSAGDIFSTSQMAHVVLARASVMRQLYDGGYTTGQIGMWMGRDPSTVHYHVTKAA